MVLNIFQMGKVKNHIYEMVLFVFLRDQGEFLK